MRYATYSPAELPAYPVCFLVPTIRKDEIRKAYIDGSGIDAEDVLIIDLHYAHGKKKTPMTEMKAYISEELAPTLTDMGVQFILVADGDYFKALTKSTKIEAHLGYVMDCAFGPWKVVYAPNYRQIFYDPDKVKAKIAQATKALVNAMAGCYQAPGIDIIKFADYPQTDAEIAQWLGRLLELNVPLAIDIETFSLKHHTAGIGTITLCWSQHEGIAFAVDYEPIEGATEAPFGRQVRNERRREMLRHFFRSLSAKALYHSISFDAYVLIYQLFMDDILDTEGLLEGLEVMLRNWDCTKLITYLATNSCAGNRLGLKDQAQEFSGNYAMTDIEDITRIPLPQLLQYNLVDGLSTWFVYNKHWETVIADQQLEIYETLFKPATLDIIQMQLTGLPLNMKRVLEVKEILGAIEQSALQTIDTLPLVQRFTHHLREKHVRTRNAELKKKRITMADAEVALVVFNPNSGPQLQELLYEMCALPVIAHTDSKEPSTNGKTLESLKNHTTDKDVLAFLYALIDYKAVNKILTSFIPAFENAAQGPDGWHYLFGNFNLGGTLSGRLSSSDPNLQNLPANASMKLSDELLARFGEELKPYTKKGKLSLGKFIKSCFEAPPGWIFAGLDFSSLEDRISALTTKDPNKLKVYTDGYDGHCLRAQAYFGDQMQDIDPNSVESINSIEKKYPDLRQNSKIPTFALTYQGTVNTLMSGSGLSRELATKVYNSYHELYRVSDEWIAARLNEASRTGYVTVAFGLRVRTPLLKQVIRGTSKTPYEAEAEGRSAGNALGQSWCLLNSRAGVEFNGIVRASKHRLDIRPCAQIHDAQYFLIRDDIEALKFTNTHLVDAVQWQDHPEIAHDEVKLGGEVSVFYPTWAEECVIPNGASEKEIFAAIEAHVN
jgi:DNA polymerase-1